EGGVGVVDQLLRDAVVADAGETPFAVGRAQLGDEGVAVAVVAGDVEGGNAGTHGNAPVGNRRRHRGGREKTRRRGTQPAAAERTASARRSRVACISAWSSASTVTRTTGSVPDGRRKARPLPCTAAWAACRARRTPSDSTTALAGT